MATPISPSKRFVTQAIFAGVGTTANLRESQEVRDLIGGAITQGASTVVKMGRNPQEQAILRDALRIGGSLGLKLAQNLIRTKLLYKTVISRPSNRVPNENLNLGLQVYSEKYYQPPLKEFPAISYQKPEPVVKTPRIASLIRYDLKNIISTADVSESEVKFQCVPLEMEYEPSANWVTIPTVGRNNPFYQYTGGEDILKFTLDWYSNQPDNKDVITKCRFIEALTRNDGYTKEPPVILLIFGELFKQSKWILTAAPYKLSLFRDSKSLLPVQAYQEITLRRYTETNREWSDIKGIQ